MKKTVYLLLCVCMLLLLFPGCENEEPQEQQYVPPEKLRQLIDTAECGEYSEKPHSQMFDGECPCFEQHIDECTDIIKAKYVETYQIPNEDYLHEFEVIEILRGTDTPPMIYVTSFGIIYDGHYTTDIRYEKGKDYLLLLKRQIGPNDDGYGSTYTNFTQEADVVIPLDDSGAPDITNSLYCKGKLLSYITDEKLIEATKNGRFLDELLLMVENNPYVFKGEAGTFIDSDDINTIIENTPYIFMVEFSSIAQRYSYDLDVNRDIIALCRVKTIYKGEEDFLNNQISVKFPSHLNDTKNGTRFLVLLNTLEQQGFVNETDFELSSRYSIYSFGSDEAKAILDTIE